ncbi:indolepyruvate ferredoxin oxidoreductase family protein [uncultured Dechloromonas sp.]|uniref:indolepyruvate ferredoxin oxidoreductase family protein n=1 Tax=uncultured Dechloromonas sp. TaxID=171719 RepID=UPI0025E55327|nr:indolepyruvate ferredoxin oxidoreductase family protein [uncultured Dechloromonas sp.]
MNAPLNKAEITLDDKFEIQDGWVYMTGNQALARLPLLIQERDKANGLNTGGFISGYRGSPLGRYDMELWTQKKRLAEHNIKFQPGVNEDLAATMVAGTQYVGVFPGATVDGVFGIWYGKGPGVDRTGDVFRHANSSGTHKHGGVLALAGDDHGAKSSTIANFSDEIFIATGIPVLYPSNTQDLIDFGLFGIALSRYSGCWVGIKVHNDVVEGGGSVRISANEPTIAIPEHAPAPHLGPAGFNTRLIDNPLIMEDRLVNHKLHAVTAFLRANPINVVAHECPGARLGILAAGKAYQDLLQALSELGLNDARLTELGIRIGKIGMVWPLETEFIKSFVDGLDTVVVIEEKKGLIEDQLKTQLYDLKLAKPPRIVGKFNASNPFAPERGQNVFAAHGELSPPIVAKVLVDVLRQLDPACPIPAIALPAPKMPPGVANPASPSRIPTFCSGCPHNRSTKVPEGSRAVPGIGCHAMAIFNNPVATPPAISQMGGEGLHWIGQQPFTKEKHVFANIGDGTYFHSGFLAIRQAIAAKAPITYKILVNGFVSMTGGQPIDGELSVPSMVSELLAEGVKEIVVLTDEVAKHPPGSLPNGVPVLPRTELDAVMKRFREYPGVSVIVYDQPCATERRRLRKRGKWIDPPKRTFINAAVCEGCGDCSKASNCLSVEPLETPFGRKRKINQSACNKDYSCIEGFCPSFVTVHGGALRKIKKAAQGDFPSLPEPVIPALDKDFSILITGIGGTGVVTVGQVLGMAAHVQGIASSVLDVTGLAQKFGAVMSHVRLAPDASHLHATRIAYGEADAIVGCDLVVTAGDEALSKIRNGRTQVFVASDVVPTSEFVRNPDWKLEKEALLQRLQAVAGDGLTAVEGLRLASLLMGDTIAANMFMLGLAWQRGSLPLTHQSIMKAIELNNVQIEFNKQSFLWGRRAAHDLAAVEKAAVATSTIQFAPRIDMSRDAVVTRSAEFLKAYQDEAYAKRYLELVKRAVAVEEARGLGKEFSTAVARYYFKLLAIKDEFEVSRLYASEAFKRELEATFEGDYKVHFHLGQWPFGGVDQNGKPFKKEVGPWLMKGFQVLSKFKGLRGSFLDVYRNSAERKMAHRLLEQYEQDIDGCITRIAAGNYATAVQIASLPEKVRGYGHVREQHAATMERERAGLLDSLAQAAC